MKPPALCLQNYFKGIKCSFPVTRDPLPNYLYNLDENIKVHNFHKVLRKVHDKSGRTIRSVAKEIGIHEVTYRHHLSGVGRANFNELKRLNKIYNVDFLKIAFDENYLLTTKRKAVQLPRKLTKELAYYIGYLQGDGYLRSTKNSLGFSDEYLEQIKIMGALTKKLFGIDSVIIAAELGLAKKPCYSLVVNSFIVNSFIHNYFGIIRGIKTELRIPKIMFSNKEILKFYISGLYDADGTLPKHPDKVVQFFLDITMKDKVFMQEIKAVLKSFGIETLKLYERIARYPTGIGMSHTWEIRIRRHAEMLKFLQIIGFPHPDKIRRQKELIQMLL